MATEIELKLRLTPKTAKQLVAHPLLAGLPAQKLHLLNTYYDTSALELHARRIALRFRKKGEQWLLTVKSAEPASGGLAVRNEWETPASPGVFDFAHVDFPELKGFLDNAVDELKPVFTTNFRRTLWHVPFGDSLIELAVDRGSIESKGRQTTICEMELELLSGHLDDIFGLTRKLQKDFDLRPAVDSKAERGYALFTDEPQHPFHAAPVALSAELTPVEAFRRIALNCLEHLQRNEFGLLAGGPPEFIHQARVALRRLRSAIKLFSPVLPRDFVDTYGATWKTLAGALGTARNWDVFLTETLPPILQAYPEHRDALRLQSEGLRRAHQARQAITDLLQQKDYPRLIIQFTATVYALSDAQPHDLKSFAQQRLAAREKSARRQAEQSAALDATQRHQLRIRIKKLRYALDFFSPLLPAKAMKRYLAKLAHLQSHLGNINDLVTAEQLIANPLKNRPAGPVHGWIAGRHALLCQALPGLLNDWLNGDKKWSHQ